jgi:hypothetical protein
MLHRRFVQLHRSHQTVSLTPKITR